MPNKLWIDDLRYPPDVWDPNCWHCSRYSPCCDHRSLPSEWEWVKTYNEALEALQTQHYEVVSFDNDLGLASKQGYQVADWLEAAVYRGEVRRPDRCAVHSMNPVAANRIRATLQRFTLVE